MSYDSVVKYGSNASSDVFKNINKEELKENISAPDLSRSTLADQIDYDLVNFKINESSLNSSVIERNQNTSNLNENKAICTDVKPKLMNFLNKEKILPTPTKIEVPKL